MVEAIVQGFIQGLTEFLPVSSSGHLVLAQHLFRFDALDPAFNVFVQGGTIVSLLAYYAPRLNKIKLTPQYIGLLVLATIPAAIAGVVLEDKIDTLFSGLDGLAVGFFLTTICVGVTYWVRPKAETLTLRTAVLIGLAQAVAILPSLSRSGATIGVALMLGVTSSAAFDFSFLLSVPVMVGSTVLSIRHLTWTPDNTAVYLVGFSVAAVTGYLTLMGLSRVMRQGKFYLFAPYTAFLALVSWILAS